MYTDNVVCVQYNKVTNYSNPAGVLPQGEILLFMSAPYEYKFQYQS